MKSKLANRLVLTTILGMAAFVAVADFVAAQAEEEHAAAETGPSRGAGLIAIGAGLAVGLTGIGTGHGEKDIGAAAVGAMAEDPAMFGRGLIMTVIPETIVIFGLVMAILLWLRIPAV